MFNIELKGHIALTSRKVEKVESRKVEKVGMVGKVGKLGQVGKVGKVGNVQISQNIFKLLQIALKSSK